ncbi:hypothetical protein LEN26_017312 [Aphanomyces euteiches]|nr:hypothetical protein LEN26_017312 [Aphanomyces euteiches]KAH9109216.1 hypothetical protein AeMF1_015677 [Aphanomyces euteiches]KAH9191766.1 hypothetical protein AeNC1_006263 [Aphanomyces euteiches]
MPNTTPIDDQTSVPELGYWALRGLGEAIRLLLVYTKTPFTDKLYEVHGEPGNWDKSEWLSVKFTLGMEFPNLPYYIDEDIKLTESNAILSYIASKHDLIGRTPMEQARCAQLRDIALVLRDGWTRTFYATNIEPTLDIFKTKFLPAKLEPLNSYKAKHEWFSGDSLTYVDFTYFELFDELNKYDAALLKPYPALCDFVDKFETMSPHLNAYIKSDKHANLPVNNKMAWFR